MHIELINNTLAYIHPKYQISTRKNDNLEVDFDTFDENYIENDPLKFEETELVKLPDEEFKDDQKYLFPLVPDDQFVDKVSLMESIPGKTFKEVYKSYFEKEEKKPIEKLKQSIKKLLESDFIREKREERLKNEQNKLSLRESYVKKNNNFESLFVKMIRMKIKSEEEKQKEKENNNIEEVDDYIEEEEDEEEELNLLKIKSGEYQVKEKPVPLRAMALKMKEEIAEKKKEPQDNLSKSKVTENRSNHKVVEVKHLSNKKLEGPQDSVKK
jgi:hypothetical protein